METLPLSLRQRKLLHTLQKQNSYITGTKLADMLRVSSRTIRSDIAEINLVLAPHQATILSTHSKGYLFQAENPQKIKELNRIDAAFFTKEDRIHYLTQRLCLSDEPLNLFDLEDEIFISHTTLMYDLQTIKKKYTMDDPYIQMILSKNEIAFEKDEAKIRRILLNLSHENWDYTNKGNALYDFHFLDWDFVSFVAAKLPGLLHDQHIFMEDPALVALELSLAIMYYRVQSGHPLPEGSPFPMTDTPAYMICKNLFSLLEMQFQCTFPKSESDAIYLFISNMSVLDIPPVSRENMPLFFGPVTIETAGSYLTRIKNVFGIDFSEDDDFYWTLLLYLRDLHTGRCIFTHQQNMHDFKDSLLGECEFAYLFQEFAPSYMGRRLTETELANLAFLFSGAICYHLVLHPEKKLKAVLCCHEKLTTSWALKRKLLARFQNYINITALLPVHSKTTFDFSGTDLILTTVNKRFENASTQKTIMISDQPSADLYDLDLPIQLITMQSICPMPPCSVEKLFQDAYWHEQESFSERFPIIETLVSDFIREGIASDHHLLDILSREATFTFIIKPGITFLYTFIPAGQTRLSIMTLQHRIIWNECKIRTIVTAVFRKEDINLLFHLKILFYKTAYDLETIKNLKTKESLMNYFFQKEQ